MTSLLEAVQHVIDNYSNLQPDIIKLFTDIVWEATRYLNGSVTNEIPYESVYSLDLALKEWHQGKTVICTALLGEKSYHFQSADPTGYIKQIDASFDTDLIQIALPQLYKNLPLFNVPLYHELGHFVDVINNISAASILLDPVDHSQLDQNGQQQLRSHRQEYFADLFASCYVGRSMIIMLNNIAGGQSSCPTHPATSDRLELIDDLIAGRKNELIDLFNSTLVKMGLPQLTIRYSLPDVEPCFSNLRPIRLESDEKIHGIFEASWAYAETAYQKKTMPWSELADEDVTQIINDLTEKSIRNSMIVRKWENGTAK